MYVCTLTYVGMGIIFAGLLWIAFPVKEFSMGIPDKRILKNVRDVFHMREVFSDILYNFNPTYKDYSVQKSENELNQTVLAESTNSSLGRNLGACALEMSERYRGKRRRLRVGAERPHLGSTPYIAYIVCTQHEPYLKSSHGWMHIIE